ncbi:MAG: LPS export ABC transporter ATP-binding protein [Nitrospinae bacterium]|nr:LPS export ABC transporter ATP-binding protein [Nitrospinota bacterium]
MELKSEYLVKAYKGRCVVDRVSVNVHEGEVVGLLGPNGAGKTTTFYMIVGLERPEEGHVFFGENEITQFPMYQRARMGIGYLPQEASIFRNLTVHDNLMAVLQTMKLSKSDRKERLELLLEEFHIKHICNSKGYSLSGGERRRVEIARVLATAPHFILLDEPFSGIDPIAVVEIQKIISHLKDQGIGVLITDHNVRETLKVIDRAYILNEGQIIEEGNSDEIMNSEKARKSYLGDAFSL